MVASLQVSKRRYHNTEGYMAKILVTGATGYVGKRLIMYLLNQGHEIYALCYIKGIRVFNEDKKTSLIFGAT